MVGKLRAAHARGEESTGRRTGDVRGRGVRLAGADAGLWSARKVQTAPLDSDEKRSATAQQMVSLNKRPA